PQIVLVFVDGQETAVLPIFQPSESAGRTAERRLAPVGVFVARDDFSPADRFGERDEAVIEVENPKRLAKLQHLRLHGESVALLAKGIEIELIGRHAAASISISNPSESG